jgi:hypothetical protein
MPDRSAPHSPMAPLPGAARGVWPFVPLTPVTTPEAARAALAAEADTSIIDPVGMRRLWVRELNFLTAVILFVLMVALVVKFIADDRELTGIWLILMPLIIVANTTNAVLPAALCRALPAPGTIPRTAPARWRWYRRLRQATAVAAPPAGWPAGAEAYALLSGAASVYSVTPGWLCERVGLPADVGTAWVASLRCRGWLAGGGHYLGLASLPELHLQLTPAGREALLAERARLTALADS